MNEERTEIRQLQPFTSFEDLDAIGKKAFVLQLPSYATTRDEVRSLIGNYGKIVNLVVFESVTDLANVYCERLSLLHKTTPTFPYAVVEFESYLECLKAVRKVRESQQSFTIVPFKPNSLSISKLPSLVSFSNLNKNSANDGDLNDEIASLSLVRSDEENSNSNNKRIRFFRKKSESISAPEMKNYVNMLPYSSKKKEDGQLIKRSQVRPIFKSPSVVILRQPKGPDGTMGFHEGRSKAKLPSPEINF